MLSHREFLQISRSADVQLLMAEIQKRGEELSYPQGSISSAQAIAYRVLRRGLYEQRALRFECLGGLAISLLDIAGKIGGVCKRICRKVAEVQLRIGTRKELQAVRKIFVGDREAVRFVSPELAPRKESSPRALLMAAVLVSMYIGFNYLVEDMHMALYRRFKSADVSNDFRKVSWVVLSDSFRAPFALYFTSKEIIHAAADVAIMICHKDSADRCQELRAQIFGSAADSESVLFIKEHITQMYITNYELTKTVTADPVASP